MINLNKKYTGLNIPFRFTYNNNYEDTLWHHIYSILVMNKTKTKSHFLKDIHNVIQQFSNGKIIYLNDLKDKIILFDKLIVGSSHQCQSCVSLDYSLKYSREYNITRLYRERMYKVYDIKPSFNYPIEGIIVSNKRYSQYEMNLLINITKHYQNSNYIKLYYIDFKNIKSFYKQLKLMRGIHIYISGPGTCLLNFLI